jgi:hypothetical protein
MPRISSLAKAIAACVLIAGTVDIAPSPCSQKMAALQRNPYGLFIYVVMNFVVLPHTRTVGHRVFTLPVTANAIAALIFCMGLPLAILSRRILSAD